MPRTTESIVDSHREATARRAAGRPVWDRRVNVADVFHNEAMTFEQRRDAIARRLRASDWLAGRDMFDGLVLAVEGLEQAEDADEFDGWWDEIYDHADADRVWIETTRRVTPITTTNGS
jgi:hypothetical protein